MFCQNEIQTFPGKTQRFLVLAELMQKQISVGNANMEQKWGNTLECSAECFPWLSRLNVCPRGGEAEVVEPRRLIWITWSAHSDQSGSSSPAGTREEPSLCHEVCAVSSNARSLLPSHQDVMPHPSHSFKLGDPLFLGLINLFLHFYVSPHLPFPHARTP